MPGISWQSISLSASETLHDHGEMSLMPTYQYRCTECGTDLEAVQKFSDPALTECPTCQGSLRKVFNAVGVVFKGSGFYRTDSRPKEGASNGSSSDSGGEKKDKDSAGNGSTEKKSSDAGSTSGSNGSNGSSGSKPDAAKTPAKASSGSSTGSSSSS